MILIRLVDCADQWMNNPSGALQQLKLGALDFRFARGRAANNLACVLGTTFDRTSNELFDALFDRDLVKRDCRPLDPRNVLNH